MFDNIRTHVSYVIPDNTKRGISIVKKYFILNEEVMDVFHNKS